MNNVRNVSSMQQLIARTLRWGVGLACAIATIGGVLYLLRHGSEPLPDYTHFSYDAPENHPAEYTTLSGIWQGVFSGTARSWIQLGVIVLILTPVMRVLLSLVEYLREHDWLYAFITSVVLAVILCNSFQIF